MRRLVCTYAGHRLRRTKVALTEVDIETGRQVTHLVLVAACLRCREELL